MTTVSDHGHQLRAGKNVPSAVVALVLVLAATATVALITTRDGSGSPLSPSGYPTLPVETFVGKIEVDPLPEAVEPEVTVSLADAVGAAEANGFPKSMRPGAPVVGLGLVSFDVTGGLPVEEGAIDTSYVDRAAWVVVYLNSPADLHGPADMVAKAPHYTCNLVIVIDALAGDGVIDAQQVCQQ